MSPVIRQRVNQPSCSLFNIYIYIRHFFSFVNKENNSSITRIPTTPSNEIASCIYVNGNDCIKLPPYQKLKKQKERNVTRAVTFTLRLHWREHQTSAGFPISDDHRSFNLSPSSNPGRGGCLLHSSFLDYSFSYSC
jgi:hypothetical protein